MLQDMREGAGFIWQNRVFSFLIGLAYWHMGFGVSMSVLYPVIAKDVLHVGPDVLGVMWGAMGAGSLLGVVVAAHWSAPGRQRWVLSGGQLLLGLGMLGFAVIPIYWLSLALLFTLGAGSSAFNVGIQQNLQILVPNQLRGRVLGVWGMVHSSVRPLGEMQFSAMATLFSAPFAVLGGGLAIIASAVFFTIYGRPMRDLVAAREAADESRASIIGH